ncbi:glycosyltransferase family 4 protein [Collybiopsis luxurians FD-317 M1]|uniref:Glycosyltransferase family 4 protein n=1 Tax=Collybiopsis luxurians FD-317 M1 TaxID=944289 RepID=A0A0D0D143_9AGAR|nr:glycosyltransferase family 4 protein [Collybiopsis luxurians FD-317 M1]
MTLPSMNDTGAKRLLSDAKNALQLWTRKGFGVRISEALHAGVPKSMSEYANGHVSDEVGTVGDAATVLYLAVIFGARKSKIQPNGAWLNDMFRAATDEPYREGDPGLLREGLNVQG